jgi:hypothetical protein
MTPTAKWFTEAAIFTAISRAYEQRGLIGNAELFRVKAIYALARGLAALAATGMQAQ